MTTPSREDLEAAGLAEGLEGAEREARMELLEDLVAQGVGMDELRQAVRESRLVLLPVERALSARGPRYTPLQVTEMTGVEPEMLMGMNRALGLPEVDPQEAALDDHDVESARILARFREAGISDDDILDMTRVIGIAMARIAEGNREVIWRTVSGSAESEAEMARRLEHSARILSPQIATVLQYALNRHLREQVQRDVIAADPPALGGADVCVCFADIVGFTKLGERLPSEELGRVARRLGELASASARPPVRLIKLIGDAAMLVSRDAGAGIDAALSLVEAADAEGEGFPQIRAGLAWGEALGRGGDWYGQPVNLASRITGIARPGTVLLAESVREQAGDGFVCSFAGERRLKGLDSRVRLYRVRRQTR
ncbi:MAG: adenylate cyclase regulatory domain-containing protein [Solirubrobacterales bacterium]